MTPNFTIWALDQGKKSACQYYRIETPILELEKAGLAYGLIDDGRSDKTTSVMARIHSDIALHYAVCGEGSLHNILSMKHIPPMIKNDREVYPPALIYDIDDNNDFVHPFNMGAFFEMGVRGYPDARLLKPGEGLIIEDHLGRQIANWTDGEVPIGHLVPFNVSKNLHEMKVRHQIIRECHGVTVPSNTLARYMRDVIGAKNVYIFPNTIVPEHYENFNIPRKEPKAVRILWQGGLSHFIDWYPLRDAIKIICQKYPHIKIVIFGEWFNWMHDVIPNEMVEHHKWVPYEAYKMKRALLDIDINLCPLVKNVFNSCKSAIKWYEASVWEKPEATLASNVPPYSEEIVDGQTGLLYDTPTEFVEKLSLLIENVDLRHRLAANSREWIFANRTPEQTIPGLFDFYTETRARQRRDLGKPIIKRPTFDEIKSVGTPLR